MSTTGSIYPSITSVEQPRLIRPSIIYVWSSSLRSIMACDNERRLTGFPKRYFGSWIRMATWWKSQWNSWSVISATVFWPIVSWRANVRIAATTTPEGTSVMLVLNWWMPTNSKYLPFSLSFHNEPLTLWLKTFLLLSSDEHFSFLKRTEMIDFCDFWGTVVKRFEIGPVKKRSDVRIPWSASAVYEGSSLTQARKKPKK